MTLTFFKLKNDKVFEHVLIISDLLDFIDAPSFAIYTVKKRFYNATIRRCRRHLHAACTRTE